MRKQQEVWIFYSSETGPDIPDAYAQGIEYLHDSNVKTNIVDVRKHPELEEMHKILATHVMLIKKGKESHKFVGVKDSMTKLLNRDLVGKSILHSLGFRKGRDLAKNLKFPKKKLELENVLKSASSPRKINNFTLMEFEVNKNHARIRFTSNLAKELEETKAPVCSEISAMLGGFFTEIFNKGTHFRETKCIS
jgi:predicted hydrocarbon binding protein